MPARGLPVKHLRIAFLLDNGPSNWRGQEEFHFRLCRALAERGATPVVIYSGTVSEQVLARMRTSGAEVIAGAGHYGIGHYRQILALTFKRFSTNLVHLRYFVYYSIIPWLVRCQSVRRIVYTEANGGLAKQRSRWSWRQQLLRARTRLACWPLSRFVAVSNFIRDRAVSSGVQPGKIRVVHNGVDIRRFTPDAHVRSSWRKEHGIDDDEVVITNVNRLDPIKDVGTIIRAFAELTIRGVPARLFIAGAGSMETDLKALGTRLGVLERIHWLGHLPDPLPLYQGSDIFTLSSLGEAFGFVLAEAMACGVPCVASQCGGIGEVVAHDVTGLLIPPQDPQSFADAYERLARDAVLRATMGYESVDRVRRLFNVDKAVEDTLAVYRELLD